MRRCNEVDVVATAGLQDQHGIGKLRRRDGNTLTLVTDLEILAEDTQEITSGKKYSPGAVVSNQRALLAEVRTVTRYDSLIARQANPQFS
jgi:hypothetical protein